MDNTLYAHILGIVEEAIPKASSIRQQQLAASLSQFCLKAITKFRVGQEEHGGDIQDRDLDEEIFNEIIDLMWYVYAKKWLPSE